MAVVLVVVFVGFEIDQESGEPQPGQDGGPNANAEEDLMHGSPPSEIRREQGQC